MLAMLAAFCISAPKHIFCYIVVFISDLMAAFEKPCPKLLPGPQSPPTSPKKGGVWNDTKHCLIKCDVGLLILSSVSWMVFHQESSMNAQCIFSYRTSLGPHY